MLAQIVNCLQCTAHSHSCLCRPGHLRRSDPRQGLDLGAVRKFLVLDVCRGELKTPQEEGERELKRRRNCPTQDLATLSFWTVTSSNILGFAGPECLREPCMHQTLDTHPPARTVLPGEGLLWPHVAE